MVSSDTAIADKLVSNGMPWPFVLRIACGMHHLVLHSTCSRLAAMCVAPLWSSGQDSPHEYPLDYHMIRNLGILNWAYRRNERPDLIFSVPRRARHQKSADHRYRRPYTRIMAMKLGTYMRIICIYLWSI